VTQVGADSTFTLLGLKTGRRYLVLAHGDVNRDREFDRELDFLAVAPTPILLDPGSPRARGVAIDFRNPRSPGGIAGAVRDSAAADSAGAPPAAPDTTVAVSPDTTAAPRIPIQIRADLVVLVEDSLSAHWGPTEEEEPMTLLAEADTSGAAASALADSLGHYELRNLRAGFYRISAYLDRNRNQRYDAGEPAASPVDSVRVVAGERTTDIDLRLDSSAGTEPRDPGPGVPSGPDPPRGP
jgi:hypothetical protein